MEKHQTSEKTASPEEMAHISSDVAHLLKEVGAFFPNPSPEKSGIASANGHTKATGPVERAAEEIAERAVAELRKGNVSARAGEYATAGVATNEHHNLPNASPAKGGHNR